MSKSQFQSGLLKGIVHKVVMLKYEDNSNLNNKSKNQAKFKHLTLKVKVIYE
jgi:hypothetical protein